MNNFEFFSLIFFMLNACWEDNKDENLAHFLSEMNPYLWNDETSADPAWYEEFKEFMKGKSLGKDNGFQLAKEYLKTIDFYPGLEKYLEEYDQDGWNDAVQQLMSQPHKGDGKGDSIDPTSEKHSLK